MSMDETDDVARQRKRYNAGDMDLRPMTDRARTREAPLLRRTVDRCGRCGRGVYAHVRFCACGAERPDA